jgi:hypothetical protein
MKNDIYAEAQRKRNEYRLSLVQESRRGATGYLLEMKWYLNYRLIKADSKTISEEDLDSIGEIVATVFKYPINRSLRYDEFTFKLVAKENLNVAS